MNDLHGLIAYPITPFDADHRVDVRLLERLVEDLVQSGVHAIAPLGSTGVLPYLSDAERELVTATVVEKVGGRLPTVVGVSSLTTERTLHHARHAKAVGASALMILPMSYWPLTEAEILRHYQTIGGEVDLPIVVYNNPKTSGIDMAPPLIARLLELPNVRMVKESSGDVRRMHALRQLCGPEVRFFNGSNPLVFSALAAGASGWCTAAPQIIPEANLALWRAFEQGELEEARRRFHAQLPLLEFLVAHGLPRTIAAALELKGIRVGPLRAPLQPLEPERRAELQRLLAAVEPSTSRGDAPRLA